VARQLAARGCRVYVTSRKISAAEKAASSLKGDVQPLEIDVSSEKSIRAAAEAFIAQEGRLDVLVNNAGILLPEDKDLASQPPATFTDTLKTNTHGPLLMAQAFLPALRKSDAPRIINVSSGGGQLSDGGGTWAPAYCISKTALNGVTCQLAAALPDFAVNSVCPGWVRTDMGGAGASRSVEEGADTMVWLATEAPQKLSGKFLRDRKEIPW